jgi:hypothetical protein
MLHRYFYSIDKDAPGLQQLKLDQSHESIHGEVRCTVAIMETGVVDLDYEYILGKDLQTDCDVLDFDYESVKAAFVGMAELIKLNKEWRG